MKTPVGACVVLVALACTSPSKTNPDSGTPRSDAGNTDGGGAQSCASRGLPATSISGVVSIPNGALPLPDVDVYVPATTPVPALPAGASCTTCAAGLPGGALVQTRTDASGHFQLSGIAATTDVPVVIAIGKWRKVLSLPSITACADTVVDADDTRLPTRHDDLGSHAVSVDLPHVAITTGTGEALECLPHLIGVDATEITNSSGTGHFQLFADLGAGSGNVGTMQFASGWAGGSGNFSDAAALWSSSASLAAFDEVLFACEGQQLPNTKPQPDMDAVKAYADDGGRLYLSHWGNVWIEGDENNSSHAPQVWRELAVWDNAGTAFDTAFVDTTLVPGFADWLADAGASFTAGQYPVVTSNSHSNLVALDAGRAEQWAQFDNGGTARPATFAFTTPNESPAAQRCGRVIFSDVHFSPFSASSSGVPYPNGCTQNALTPQDKAAIYAFFQLGRCVGSANP